MLSISLIVSAPLISSDPEPDPPPRSHSPLDLTQHLHLTHPCTILTPLVVCIPLPLPTLLVVPTGLIPSTTGDPRGRALNPGNLPPRAQVTAPLAVANDSSRKPIAQYGVGWLHNRRHRRAHRRFATIINAAATPVAAYSSRGYSCHREG